MIVCKSPGIAPGTPAPAGEKSDPNSSLLKWGLKNSGGSLVSTGVHILLAEAPVQRR